MMYDMISRAQENMRRQQGDPCTAPLAQTISSRPSSFITRNGAFRVRAL